MKPVEKLAAFVLMGALFTPSLGLAGQQREEDLANDVRTAMRSSIENANTPYLVFSTPEAADAWFQEMKKRLGKFLDDEREIEKILVSVQYEAVRAGLDPQLVLSIIQVESRFRRYSVSNAKAMGLMQVMPFWVNAIGTEGTNLFEIGVNLRYGCTILRYYLNKENGDLVRALGRYNGSLGSRKYPDLVLGAYKKNWAYDSAL